MTAPTSGAKIIMLKRLFSTIVNYCLSLMTEISFFGIDNFPFNSGKKSKKASSLINFHILPSFVEMPTILAVALNTVLFLVVALNIKGTIYVDK